MEEIETPDVEGETRWYLFDAASDKVSDDPTEIVSVIRCAPETPRRHVMSKQTLSEIRAKVEKHIYSTYVKQVQIARGRNPVLKAWMELS
jgi:hypothetical protein